MNDADLRAISELQARQEIIEEEVARLRDGQDAIRKELNDAAKGSVNMCKDLEAIKEALVEMTRKKVRAIDIAIIIVGLTFAGISAYAAVQNNQLTKIMINIERNLQ